MNGMSLRVRTSFPPVARSSRAATRCPDARPPPGSASSRGSAPRAASGPGFHTRCALRPARERDPGAGVEAADRLGGSKLGPPREHAQELLVAVVKVIGRDRAVRIELVERGAELLRSRVAADSRPPRAEGRLGEVHVPFARVQVGLTHASRCSTWAPVAVTAVGAFQSTSCTMTPLGSRTWKARSPHSSSVSGIVIATPSSRSR